MQTDGRTDIHDEISTCSSFFVTYQEKEEDRLLNFTFLISHTFPAPPALFPPQINAPVTEAVNKINSTAFCWI
jgi:hypothetical protein